MWTLLCEKGLKDRAQTFNIRDTAWKADHEACQKADECTIAYEALSKASLAGYTESERDTETRKALNKPSVTAGRSQQRALRDDEEVSGGLNTSETLAADAENLEQLDLNHVDHIVPAHRLGRHARRGGPRAAR